jgi:DNA-binding transcriptional ArsR family regulator
LINQADDLSITFAALADPTRRAILSRLKQGDATVNELARPFTISLQAVSKHLKVLEKAGLIARGRDRQLRPSKIQGEALGQAAGWLEDYRSFWDESFDRLEEHLK